MQRVAQLCVTGETDGIRLRCRQVPSLRLVNLLQIVYAETLPQVMLQFLMDYPLGKQLKRYLDYFLSNLR